MKRKTKRYRYIVGVACEKTNCLCSFYSGKIIPATSNINLIEYCPPRHELCDCYLIPEDSYTFDSMNVYKACIQVRESFKTTVKEAAKRLKEFGMTMGKYYEKKNK